MPSEKPSQRFREIIENAAMVATFTAGMDFATFEADFKTCAAVHYCLLRISEAASKLGDLAPAMAPEQPWASIRALGNYLRHEYDRIELNQIWAIVEDGLPRLSVACKEALKRV